MTTNRDKLKVVKQQVKSLLLERIPVAFRKFNKAILNTVYNKSTYLPHQGQQEINRRRQQIERGFIRVN